jgi:hypothetical protein
LSCAAVNEPAEIVSPVYKKKIHVAVFPVENLSGTKAPLEDIRQSLILRLKEQGINIIEVYSPCFKGRNRVRRRYTYIA